MLDFILRGCKKVEEKPKTVVDAIRSLGYIIDDGDIILETPNKLPLKVGVERGEQNPTIVYDPSCKEQVFAANEIKRGLRSLGYEVELTSRSSYGELSKQVQEVDDWLRSLREVA